MSNRTLLIGWDAADWKVMRPLLDGGRMPHTKRLIENGAAGDLSTLNPILSPMLWNSIATGKRPSKHGILGFTEPRPGGQGIRPVTSTSRKCKALWNIATQEGLGAHAINWYASHPAEPIRGVSVSKVYSYPTAPYGEPWPLPAGTVHPERVADALAEARVHPGDLDRDAILPFLPHGAEIDQEKDQRVLMLAKVIAETFCAHSAITFALEREPWDFAAVLYDSIDHFCHGFMWYHPPQMNGVPDADFRLYKDVINGAYCLQDLLLGRVLELAGDETNIVIVSDHGFHSDHLRPRRIPGVPAGPAIGHRPHGIAILHGPGVKKGVRLRQANILDVTPTILTLKGLPVGADMDGRAWSEVLEGDRAPETIPSWEERPGACGMHPEDLREDTLEDHAVLQQMIDLGYVEKLDADVQKAIDICVREQKYNLAVSLIAEKRPHEAAALLEEIAKAEPLALRYQVQLVAARHMAGQRRECRELVEKLVEGHDTPLSNLARAHVENFERRPGKALEYLRKVEETSELDPRLHKQIGEVHSRLGRWDEALGAYRRAAEIDPHDPHAKRGMATAAIACELYDEAIEYALDAVELAPHEPLPHYYLGIALWRSGKPEEGAVALENAAAIAPQFAAAHRRLATLYRSELREYGRSAEHMLAAKQIRETRAAVN
jgi:predicted AlkP superfamily phosphohydrolase/phosphomutase/tetratricopeptide (TPR) repeat protein